MGGGVGGGVALYITILVILQQNTKYSYYIIWPTNEKKSQVTHVKVFSVRRH